MPLAGMETCDCPVGRAAYDDFWNKHEYYGKEAMLRRVLHRILEDLPAKRDWLDPEIEQLARRLVSDDIKT